MTSPTPAVWRRRGLTSVALLAVPTVLLLAPAIVALVG